MEVGRSFIHNCPKCSVRLSIRLTFHDICLCVLPLTSLFAPVGSVTVLMPPSPSVTGQLSRHFRVCEIPVSCRIEANLQGESEPYGEDCCQHVPESFNTLRLPHVGNTSTIPHGCDCVVPQPQTFRGKGYYPRPECCGLADA